VPDLPATSTVPLSRIGYTRSGEGRSFFRAWPSARQTGCVKRSRTRPAAAFFRARTPTGKISSQHLRHAVVARDAEDHDWAAIVQAEKILEFCRRQIDRRG
jgi:hypothetical protein